MTDQESDPAGENGARRSVARRVSRPTFSSQIRDGLLQRITSGEYAPGHRLVETKIAAEFGTSQAPVREALRELEALGLVESRPRMGSRVVPFAEQTIREAYVVRAALEEAATRLSMLRAAVPRAAMEQAITQMRRSAETGDTATMSTSSSAFHRLVVEASDNRLLIRAWEALQIEARTSIALMVLEPDLAAVAEEHAELLQDMLGGDIERACRHAREHQLAYAQLPHRTPTQQDAARSKANSAKSM